MDKHTDISNPITIVHQPLRHEIKYNFLFDIHCAEEYDVIVHIRGTDRLRSCGSCDHSSPQELVDFIEKTIVYINNCDIDTYTIVTDDIKYGNYMKNKIKKTYVQLSYNYNVSKEWLDYYYLTKAKKNILMCCKFSSYSITASVLSNKELLVFTKSLDSNLLRYYAKLKIIDS